MNKMKIAVALVVSLVAVNLQAQIQKKQNELSVKETAEITFKETSHDFGTIKEGEVVETVFEFVNTGGVPLVISKINASCGCTVPSNWSKEPILPGDESSFSVKFNSKNKPNKQSKTIRVHSNSKKGVDYVTIKLFVTPDMELEAIRAERIKARREQYRVRKELVEAKKEEVSEKIPSTGAVVKKSDKQIEKEVAILDNKRKEIAKETDKLKKENIIAEEAKKEAEKKAKKEAKKAVKEEKAAAKKAKKLAKHASKVEKASDAVAARESKIAKLKAKMKRIETEGDLSPNEKLDYEDDIAKLNTKLKKEQKLLFKLQNK